MKAPAFDDQAPESVEEALALIGEFGDDARFLAAGQILVPLMNFRLARPCVVIDLNLLDDLSYIVAEDEDLHIGAMTRQAQSETSDLEIQDGRVFVARNSERSLSLEDLAGLEATECFDPDLQTYTSGTHVAIVEVFPETGSVKILRYVVVHDCGRIINPMIVDGEIQGGVAHGISDCLYENLQYDQEGQLLTTSYLAYLLPTACDVPPVNVKHMEIPSTLNPIGVRRAGELGTIGPPAAIAKAIEDALSPFGGEVREFPLTQDRIWQLISNATSTARGAEARVND